MREMSLKNYIIAGIITFLIFTVGILLGISLSGKRVSFSEEQMGMQKIELDSLQLQYLLIDQMGAKSNCAAISTALDQKISELSILGSRIEKFSRDMNFDEAEFMALRREYTLAQIRYWLFADRSRKICSSDTVSVLYFYSNEDECFGCSTQSRILTHLKGKFNDRLLVFSIDSSLAQEPLVPLLKQTYNITKFPSIVIGDDPFYGLVEEDSLSMQLCSRYSKKPESCEP